MTVAPRLEVARSNWGDGVLTDWKVQRIKRHYDTGITSPKFGRIIDSSDMSINETVDRILEIITKYI